MTSLFEAFDLVAHAEHLDARLSAAAATLSQRAGLMEEKGWLEAARRRLVAARAGNDELLMRVVRLPELAPLRTERGRVAQSTAADAVEALERSVRAAGGDRSPVLEALFRNVKLSHFRRYDREAFASFCDELEKRLASGYVTRMLAGESYASVAPAVDEVRRAIADWRAIFTGPAPSDAEADALRRELEGAARRLELPLRQARLLAEAALVEDSDLLGSSGILDKPKRRAARAARASTDADSPTEPPGSRPEPPST